MTVIFKNMQNMYQKPKGKPTGYSSLANTHVSMHNCHKVR